MTTKKNNSYLQSKKFYQTLLQVNNTISKTANLSDALLTLVSLTASVIGCDRGTLFLHDDTSHELYSYISYGDLDREIRILDTKGLAGWSYSNDQALIIDDAYSDERFYADIDALTGYTTKNILCVPIKNTNNELIGVSQMLNKLEGHFTETDLECVRLMTEQAALALQNKLSIERIENAHKKEIEFLAVMSQVTGEIQLSSLLERTIATVTAMLDAERSTLFINDPKNNELYTEVAQGLDKVQIRFPNHMGIAGAVFTSGDMINIPHAYADLRFNPAFDKSTGFFTRSILAAPVKNKAGQVIGVTQVLNKRRGEFNVNDESQLAAINSQISMAIENARLFDDVQSIKNYNESMLESMSNGVITVNENNIIVTCNRAGFRIMDLKSPQDIIGQDASTFFSEKNAWLFEKVKAINLETQSTEHATVMDATLTFGDNAVSANITILPLLSPKEKHMGSMIMIEDISSEKRMKSTMSRYMSPDLAEKLMQSGESSLGGISSPGTVLFSDIRGFTTLSESLGAEGTVHLLNEYFTLMVDCIQHESGMLDKFIGDAIMAVFGVPFPHDDDPDRAVRSAIRMMHALRVFNQKREEQKLPTIEHGIGINTDRIVSGNIGSEKRMDYTVIGDGVNLASRIESLCKEYGAHILISEYTFKALKATYRTRQLDRVIVKGKALPAAIYEVIDFHDEHSFPNQIEVLQQFNNGIEYYNNALWDKAIHCFQAALQLNPNDKPSSLYIERCEMLKTSQHPGEWDGVWVMTHK